LFHLTLQDLIFLRESAKTEFESFAGTLRGMQRSLNFEERRAIAWLVSSISLLIKRGILQPNCQIEFLPKDNEPTE
jgi:hypothetical protein